MLASDQLLEIFVTIYHKAIYQDSLGFTNLDFALNCGPHATTVAVHHPQNEPDSSALGTPNPIGDFRQAQPLGSAALLHLGRGFKHSLSSVWWHEWIREMTHISVPLPCRFPTYLTRVPAVHRLRLRISITSLQL